MIKVESIEFLDLNMDVYDIQVETDNSFFVYGVVAHNSICRERDNRVYTLEDAPPIPAHFSCRSRKVPYLGEFKAKGNRAAQGGSVPEDTSYGDWLRRQSKATQEEVLGVKKARLFREGGLPIDRFQDATGKEYTLAQLRQRDNEIWNEVFGDGE